MPRLTLHSSNSQLQLSAHQVLRLTGARGTRLTSRAGTLWITIDHELEDRVLEVGESLLIDSPRNVTVTSLGGDACLSLQVARSPAGAVARWRGGWQWLRQWLAPLAPRPV